MHPMTQSNFGGRGRNAGRNGCGAANGQENGRGRGAGYTSKPKTAKVGLCKELENIIFNYGVSNATNLMHTTQEKIAQYVGIKYREDIANKLTNKTTVTVAPPVYSLAILLRHQEWEKHMRKKQKNVKTAPSLLPCHKRTHATERKLGSVCACTISIKTPPPSHNNAVNNNDSNGTTDNNADDDNQDGATDNKVNDNDCDGATDN